MGKFIHSAMIYKPVNNMHWRPWLQAELGVVLAQRRRHGRSLHVPVRVPPGRRSAKVGGRLCEADLAVLAVVLGEDA